METRVVNIQEKANLITELHKYKVIAEMNDYYFKLVKAKREFVWHQHPEADAERLDEIANNKKIFDNLRDAFPYPYSIEDARKFIALQQDKNNKLNEK